jgi:hypothetical protein
MAAARDDAGVGAQRTVETLEPVLVVPFFRKLVASVISLSR